MKTKIISLPEERIRRLEAEIEQVKRECAEWERERDRLREELRQLTEQAGE